MNTEYFEGKKGRKSTRLPHWNYVENGWYFLTICTSNRENFFGNISQGKMQLSNIGKIAQKFWQDIPIHPKKKRCIFRSICNYAKSSTWNYNY